MAQKNSFCLQGRFFLFHLSLPMLLLLSLLLLAPLEISVSVQIGIIRNAWWDQSATSTQMESSKVMNVFARC